MVFPIVAPFDPQRPWLEQTSICVETFI
jgi:hypothetical protein